MKKETGQKISTDFSHEKSAESGFSLIEISILLIVIGFIFAPIIRTIEHDIERDNHRRNSGLLSNANDSINKFYSNAGGAYPCPASLTLDAEDAASGVSADCTNLNNFRNCTNPTWLTAGGGVCRTSSIAGNAVIVGAVPYAEIGTDLENSLDVWGNKLIYVIPFLNTDNLLTNNYNGVRMQTLSSTGAVIAAADAEMLLFSTGFSGVGGFTKEGNQVSACGLAVQGYDNENCDFDNIFFSNDGAFSRVPGAEFYDDITRSQTAVPATTWFEHQSNPATGGANNRFAITSSTRVGIGRNDPANSLHVNGGIRVESRDPALLNLALSCAPNTACFEPGGRVKTPSVCNDSGDCFEPEIITENRSEMLCDSAAQLHGDQPVLAVHTERVHCASPENSAGTAILEKSLRVDTAIFPTSSCTVLGEVAAGIDSAGEVICVVP